jgi:hypothetical protein
MALEETIEHLRADALASDDGSGHFPAMYARVTANVAQAASDGRFADAPGMVTFAERFAARYLRPRAGEGPFPGCWQAAWEVGPDRHLLIVQHLLLGINAHVNHDLPQVVVGLADERGDGDTAALRRDFDAVNDVLAATYPMVLHELGRLSRWVNVVASRGGTRLFEFSLTEARRQAWGAATRIRPLDEMGRAAYVADLDQLVRVLAHLIAHPGTPASLFVRMGRMVEEHDPRVVTAALLGDLR